MGKRDDRKKTQNNGSVPYVSLGLTQWKTRLRLGGEPYTSRGVRTVRRGVLGNLP